jgi:hypothetical protein
MSSVNPDSFHTPFTCVMSPALSVLLLLLLLLLPAFAAPALLPLLPAALLSLRCPANS